MTSKYNREIKTKLEEAYALSQKARALHYDPTDQVEIFIANNMAERVMGLVAIAAPQLLKTNLPERIKVLEKEYGKSDWRVALKIAEEIAEEEFCSFSTKEEALEVGIRVGFAYVVLGIVSAPLEGFTHLRIKKRRDGGEYFSLFYSGPIRGAGGTAAAFSLILADYLRVKFGYLPYDPSEEEINRYITEINDYHEKVTNLQYYPSEEEIGFLIKYLPLEINGDPTERFEVSNYQDLPRVETKRLRGGVSLVLAEGLAQKAAKLWKKLSLWAEDFSLQHWSFLADFLELQKKIKAKEKEEKKTDELIKPNFVYLKDLVIGRPVLAHPLQAGAFRLRLGRTRTTGLAATAIHPLTQLVLKKYIAIGTQLKVERPGKATVITSCDSIDPPIVKLKNGSVIHLKNFDDFKNIEEEIEEILFLGDILISYGDFYENGHRLVPLGYCPEWWAEELKEALKGKNLDFDEERLKKILQNPLKENPSFQEALFLSEKLDIPLHPFYLDFWKLISSEQLKSIVNWLSFSQIEKDEGFKFILPLREEFFPAKKALELIGLPHQVINNEHLVISGNQGRFFDFFIVKNKEKILSLDGENALALLNQVSSVKLKDKGGTFIGSRMGRPEKAKIRKMEGSPQVLFPVGEEGDRLRSFQAAREAKKVTADFPLFFCLACQKKTVYPVCHLCDKKTKELYYCPSCKEISQPCHHSSLKRYKREELDINEHISSALKRLGEPWLPDLVKGVRGTFSRNHLCEHLTKGILRAKHNLFVNKDGTIRFDATQIPITHFKPGEISTSIEKLKELGYEKDIDGRDLEDPNQILQLQPQDIILPNYGLDSGLKVLFQVTKFLDELLEKLYSLPAFYNLEREEDLIGHLVIGLAPHISAGIIGRIIGYSQTQGLLAHPLWHAALRRNADGDEAAVFLLLDGLLNFSKEYLPESQRGSTMDASLVLTPILEPSEVDEESHNLDIVWHYPLELYQKAESYTFPSQIKIKQMRDLLGKEELETFGYTHPTNNLNIGVLCSVYKTIPQMQDKLAGQMDLAKKIRAVDEDNVASLVLQKHLIRDIKGNLRQFFQQVFRCSKCNSKYRRPPLNGKCLKCGNKLVFTVSEGTITKYLEISLFLAKQYNLSPYLKQNIEIIKKQIDSIFDREKDKQVALAGFLR